MCREHAHTQPEYITIDNEYQHTHTHTLPPYLALARQCGDAVKQGRRALQRTQLAHLGKDGAVALVVAVEGLRVHGRVGREEGYED